MFCVSFFGFYFTVLKIENALFSCNIKINYLIIKVPAKTKICPKSLIFFFFFHIKCKII